ncbi:helix-turn-helix transcriptional regulator [Flavitalea flava]
MTYNRIKEVLARKGRTVKSLAEHLQVHDTTVSTWCSNRNQPPIPTFYKISQFLDVEIFDLFNAKKEIKPIQKQK